MAKERKNAVLILFHFFVHATRKKSEIITQYMESKNVDDELQVRVREYLNFIWEEKLKHKEKETKKIINKLSPPLRDELLLYTTGHILKSFPVFCNNFSDESLKQVVHIMKEKKYTPHELIFEVCFFSIFPIFISLSS